MDPLPELAKCIIPVSYVGFGASLLGCTPQKGPTMSALVWGRITCFYCVLMLTERGINASG